MIDLRLVRENPDLVRASQRARGADESLVDALLAADAARREVVKRAAGSPALFTTICDKD